MTEPTPLHPEQRVDIGALACGLQLEAANRAATTIVHANTILASQDKPLSEWQQIALIESMMRHFDGYELHVAQTLKRELEREGVPTWGLPDTLEKLL